MNSESLQIQGLTIPKNQNAMKTLFTDYQWDQAILQIGFGAFAVSAAILLWYVLRTAMLRGSTAKYAYVAAYELSYFKVIAFVFSVGVGLVLFAVLARQFLGQPQVLLYFVGMVSVGLAFVIGYALEQYFKVYYPFVLEKKLKKIRFHPRKAPNGKPMKLLREHEEDVHLTEEMIAHEEAFTFDYDVWLEEESGFKVIEKYDGHLYAKVCPRCEFRTMQDVHEEVLVEPTYSKNGLLRKDYRCTYCGHEESQEVSIASQQEEEELVHDAVMA